MSISLAIDFGTSRTKVGWRDANDKIHILDWDGEPYLPSVFHLPQRCQDILVGSDALEALTEAPEGGIENFKREILETGAMPLTYQERQDSAETLVGAMFKLIRVTCLAQIPQLDGELPETITIAIPAQASMQWRMLLEQGANSVGVLSVNTVQEPIAAARRWLYQQSLKDKSLLVIDCGGGTTDLALIISSSRRLSLSKEHRAQSFNLGGSDVDNAVYRQLLSQHPEAVKAVANQAFLVKIRKYKEAMLSGKVGKPFRIGGMVSFLDESRIEEIYQLTFVDPLLKKITPFLEHITSDLPQTEILLVGGGSCALPLEKTLKSVSSLTVNTVQERGLVVLQGCLVTGTSSFASDLGRAITLKESSSQLETPDIHGWSTQQVQSWQLEVANRIGVSVIRQDTLKGDVRGPEMVLIPPGKYLMGSPPSEHGRNNDEGPQHQIILARPFYLGQYALTFKHYDYYCETTGKSKVKDEGWGRGMHPVVNVSWNDAKIYCQWLNEQTGASYQLPSEAQWEYACRAGTTTPFWFGSKLTVGDVNFDESHPHGQCETGVYLGGTVPVNNFRPNPWGLYQMHGNLWEWCEDRWHQDYEGSGRPNDGTAWGEGSSEYRVLRGGSWLSRGHNMRSADRNRLAPSFRYSNFGFRISLSL